jgi:hypothetical protein
MYERQCWRIPSFVTFQGYVIAMPYHVTQDCPKRSEKQPAEEPEGDAEAVSKGPGEPEETTPGPEEPAGIKQGLQESSVTKSGSPGGRQTRSRTDALLRKEETNVGKPKTWEDMPEEFLELPRVDPQYQGIQGFRFGDFEEFPALGGRKKTTWGISKGPEEGPADDIEIVKEPVGGSQPGSSPAPSSTGKAPKDTAAVESVPHPAAPIPFAEAPEAPLQRRSLPVPHRSIRRFAEADMSEAGPSIPQMRTIRLPGHYIELQVFKKRTLLWPGGHGRSAAHRAVTRQICRLVQWPIRIGTSYVPRGLRSDSAFRGLHSVH